MDNESLVLKEIESLKATLEVHVRRQLQYEERMEAAMSSYGDKLKTNQELLMQRITSYVTKDNCESLRTKQGERIGLLTDEVHELKTRLNISTKITASVVSIIGVPMLLGIVYLIMMYQQVQSSLG